MDTLLKRIMISNTYRMAQVLPMIGVAILSLTGALPIHTVAILGIIAPIFTLPALPILCLIVKNLRNISQNRLERFANVTKPVDRALETQMALDEAKVVWLQAKQVYEEAESKKKTTASTIWINTQMAWRTADHAWHKAQRTYNIQTKSYQEAVLYQEALKQYKKALKMKTPLLDKILKPLYILSHVGLTVGGCMYIAVLSHPSLMLATTVLNMVCASVLLCYSVLMSIHDARYLPKANTQLERLVQNDAEHTASITTLD
jgi:tetratricopeptide (TPR) repeat protein